MYKIKCQQCGCEFEHYYYNKRFCDDCVKKRKKEYNQKLANERKEKPPKDSGIDVKELLKEF